LFAFCGMGYIENPDFDPFENDRLQLDNPTNGVHTVRTIHDIMLIRTPISVEMRPIASAAQHALDLLSRAGTIAIIFGQAVLVEASEFVRKPFGLCCSAGVSALPCYPLPAIGALTRALQWLNSIFRVYMHRSATNAKNYIRTPMSRSPASFSASFTL
jgi:hypothetical protein